MSVNAGGMPVIRPLPFYLDFSPSSENTEDILLQSDHHIGSSMVDYSRIDRELKKADERGARILLGGDIADMILPSDKKRYRPEALHPRLRGRSDIINEVLDWGEEIFSPYADRIDGIGIGNHEDNALHRHHLDFVKELVTRLNRRVSGEPKIAQLGWTSYIEYRVFNGKKKLPPVLIWYHHGIGKNSSAHRALRTLEERSMGFQADIYWSGHAHARGHMAELQMRLEKNKLVPREIRYILTGSYMLAYQDQTQESMRKNGRLSNYASEKGYRPHALGGTFLRLEWDRPGYPDRIEVVQ